MFMLLTDNALRLQQQTFTTRLEKHEETSETKITVCMLATNSTGVRDFLSLCFLFFKTKKELTVKKTYIT